MTSQPGQPTDADRQKAEATARKYAEERAAEKAAALERVRRVFPHLRALALAWRPDWDADELRAAMTAAHIAGWTLNRIYGAVYELTRQETGTPRDLAEAAKQPTWRPPPPVDPHVNPETEHDLEAARRRAAEAAEAIRQQGRQHKTPAA